MFLKHQTASIIIIIIIIIITIICYRLLISDFSFSLTNTGISKLINKTRMYHIAHHEHQLGEPQIPFYPLPIHTWWP